jgi:hypothetical protein
MDTILEKSTLKTTKPIYLFVLARIERRLIICSLE